MPRLHWAKVMYAALVAAWRTKAAMAVVVHSEPCLSEWPAESTSMPPRRERLWHGEGLART